MWSAKVYKKTKIIQTSLATVHIESEVYEERPPPQAEGPPRWIEKVEHKNPEDEKKAMQQHHLDYLFQLGQRHAKEVQNEPTEPTAANGSSSSPPIVGDVGSLSDDKNVVAAVRQQVGKEHVGLHRAVSNRRVVTGSIKPQQQQAPELPKIQEEEKYLGITLRDISNKLFSVSGDEKKDSCGVEETKIPEEDEMGKADQSNIFSFDALFRGIPFYSSNHEKPVRKDRKAPYFTDDILKKQQHDDLAPIKEIKILKDGNSTRWSCHDEMMPDDEEQGYLRRLHSDDMSCVTIPNMNQS